VPVGVLCVLRLGAEQLGAAEKNLQCVTNADGEHRVKHRQEGGLCYCIPFHLNDYQTLLVSCLGEVALVPLNICLLNVLGRKLTLTVLQLVSAILFMMLNICTTMFWLHRAAVPAPGSLVSMRLHRGLYLHRREYVADQLTGKPP
ncbi:putative transporter SVOPL, partial [Sander vitreus]